MRSERRRGNRYPLRMAAQVRSVGRTALATPLDTWTRDVSARGLLLEFEQPLREGTRLELNLRLPAEVTGTPVNIICRARVVRVLHGDDSRVALGARIEGYEFVREATATR